MSKTDFIKQVASIMAIAEYSEYLEEYKRTYPNEEYGIRMSENAIFATRKFVECCEFVRDNYDYSTNKIDPDSIDEFILEKKNQ